MELTTARADFGHCRVPADHRHDPLVAIPEGRALLAVDVGKDVLGRADARLQGDRSQLREWRAVSTTCVRNIAKRVDARKPGHRQIGLDVEPSAVALRNSGPPREALRLAHRRPKRPCGSGSCGRPRA